MDVLDPLKQGRNAYRRRAWADAYGHLSLAERKNPLDCEDLEALATAAYLTGRDQDYLAALDRAHHAHLDGGRLERAARCAFWSGLVLLFRGEAARANGWLSRAQRLIEQRDCVEQGYLLLPRAEAQLQQDQPDQARATASQAVSIGERFADPDLIACARHLEGRAALQSGQTERGLALLDETMVAVTAGELSPVSTGLVYCSVIDACQRVYELERAREWTEALARWCDRQPELVAFTSTCLVHRAEILQMSGTWPAAIEEARRACQRDRPSAAAFYQQAEIHRLRGDFLAAEEAYRNASRAGCEPQPGLALMRLAQGRPRTANAAIRRALMATTRRLQRVRLLPAHIEIALAMGDLEAAAASCEELGEIAASLDTAVPAAMAAHALGAVELARGDARAAVASLGHAMEAWQRAKVPYEAARTRVLMARACDALGDHDGARLERDAARAALTRLQAAPDLARLEAPARSQKLTPRQLQVLRLLARGKTNKDIAATLCLSRKTVDRHVSNIFAKLDVGSRAAATAYAYEHELI